MFVKSNFSGRTICKNLGIFVAWQAWRGRSEKIEFLKTPFESQNIFYFVNTVFIAIMC